MKSKIQFILSMLIFGSIGIFVKYIQIPSAQIVQFRTIIGSLCILAFLAITKNLPDMKKIKKNIKPLVVAGISIGTSWACLFEAYKTTTVGMATIIYYFAPIIVFFLAPIIFKEKSTIAQKVGISFAIIGMVLVNIMEILKSSFSMAIVFAFASALTYAVIMISNKFIGEINGLHSTLVQLSVAAVVITIYCFVTTGELIHVGTSQDMILVVVVGIVHTGIAMSLYISSMQNLSQQNISIFSYVDPASALVFAFFVLGETLSWYQIIGATLIFGGTILGQIKIKSKAKN